MNKKIFEEFYKEDKNKRNKVLDILQNIKDINIQYKPNIIKKR